MGKRLCLLSRVYITLASLASVAAVAPQDFNRDCARFVSAYEPREKVLLDTQYYPAQSLITVLGDDNLWLSLEVNNTQNSSSEQKVSDR